MGILCSLVGFTLNMSIELSKMILLGDVFAFLGVISTRIDIIRMTISENQMFLKRCPIFFREKVVVTDLEKSCSSKTILQALATQTTDGTSFGVYG